MSLWLGLFISFYLGGWVAVMIAMVNSRVTFRSAFWPAALWPTALIMALFP